MSNERFWCHICDDEVRNAILVSDEYECPICHQHFVELYEEHEQDARPVPLPPLRPSPRFIHYPIMQMMPAAFTFGPANDPMFSDMMTAVFSQISSNLPRRHRGIDVSALETYILDEGSLSHMVSAECAICQAELVVGERINSLPCSHSYHNTCIIPWLEGHDSCPICRTRIV